MNQRDRAARCQLAGCHHPKQQGDGGTVSHDHHITLPICQGVAPYQVIEAMAAVHARVGHRRQDHFWRGRTTKARDHSLSLGRRSGQHLDFRSQLSVESSYLRCADLRGDDEDALVVGHVPTVTESAQDPFVRVSRAQPAARAVNL